MRKLIFSLGYAVASGFSVTGAIYFVGLSIEASGGKGAILAGLAGLVTLGAIVNGVAFYRSLPE